MKYLLPLLLCIIISTSCGSAYPDQEKVYAPEEAKIVSVSTSSILKDKKNRYISVNICDDTSASWCEGKKDDGVGEWVQITLDRRVRIKEFYVMNGYGDARFWERNNRVKNMFISTERNQGVLVTLADAAARQCVKLSQPMEGMIFNFRVSSVYPGSQNKDTCIAEIALTTKQKFCGMLFSSFEIDLNYLRLNLNGDGTVDGSGSGGWQCGEFDSGTWESNKNGSDFSIRYTVKNKAGETCAGGNEYGSLVMVACPVNNRVVFEETGRGTRISCSFAIKEGAIAIDDCSSVEK